MDLCPLLVTLFTTFIRAQQNKTRTQNKIGRKHGKCAKVQIHRPVDHCIWHQWGMTQAPASATRLGEHQMRAAGNNKEKKRQHRQTIYSRQSSGSDYFGQSWMDVE